MTEINAYMNGYQTEQRAKEINKNQVGCMEHALSNGNRFYTESNDRDWNALVEKGFATKHVGWEESMSYFRVTSEGKKALRNGG